MGKTVVIVVMGGLLSWLAAMWAIVFWWMVKTGSVTLIEPSRPILLTELTLAICLTLCGIAALLYGAFIKKES